MNADGFGALTLVTGTESFLAERAVADAVSTAERANPSASTTAVTGDTLTPALLDQLGGADLFSTASIIALTAADKTPKAVESALIALARSVPDDVALIVAHPGGGPSRGLLDALGRVAATTVDCQPLKGRGLTAFVAAEARANGKSLDVPAAQRLVDAIGTDTRSLAAAVAQLAADTELPVISEGQVNRYFAGRATISAYLVAQDALAGRVGEAIVKLRWALATGVAHVQITTALASGVRQTALYVALAQTRRPTAEEVGVPAWRLKDVAATARSWSEPAISAAIRAVAQADAQIKGAAQDPTFALERLVLRLAALRRSAGSGAGA